jgi:predicted Rossmann fold flavoprotein
LKEADVLILGAGASGLMAALTAARRGRRVALLDHVLRPGAKVRISGGGRCNVTNLRLSAENFLSENPHFVKSALARFTPRDLLAFLDERGLIWREEEEGRIFLRDGGGELADRLERECTAAGAEFFLGRTGSAVRYEGDRFRADAGEEQLIAARLIVATGGLSWPRLGATDLGLRLAKGFGHRIVPAKPGLVPLLVKGWPYSGLSGISLRARLSCGRVSFTDGLLFTHGGVSGPAVLQVSSYFRKGEAVAVDFLPGQEVRELLLAASGKVLCKNVLAAVLPNRLVEALLPAELAMKQAAQLSTEDHGRIAGIVHGWEIRPTGNEGWAKAEVTVGGVDTAQVSSRTMESRNVPNLFFAGEVLDVTGWLGGYNLQWAWSSGVAAGAAA